MALTASGEISLGGTTATRSVNLEMLKTATATIGMNDSSPRILAQILSGQISMSSFYGRRWVKFVGATTSTSGTISLPGHQAGDIIVVIHHRFAASTITTPAGYTVLGNLLVNGVPGRVAYKIAASSAETSGNWGTQALGVATACAVYRDHGLPGTVSTPASGQNSVPLYRAVAMNNTIGGSWIIGCGLDSWAPAGRTLRAQGTVFIWDTNGGVTSYAQQSAAVGARSFWTSLTFELRA